MDKNSFKITYNTHVWCLHSAFDFGDDEWEVSVQLSP